MRPLQRPSAPLCLWDPSAVCRRSYMDRTFLLATLCTPERQSLCESHRQRRWLTYWSYTLNLTTPLQTIFQDAFPAYEQTHPLPAHVRRAARAIMQCRTAALGGHVQACPDGHMSRIWYNSCRHRSCPQCASLQTERWLILQRVRLLACDHYHVIFTLPHELNPLWLANVPVMSSLLFQVVRETLGTLLADPKYLGAQPGIIAALHTWSQTLLLHQ